jgi:hypothetical protein
VQCKADREHGNSVAALQERERGDDRHRFDYIARQRQPGACEHRVDVGAHPAFGRMQDPRHAGKGCHVDCFGSRQRVPRPRHQAQRLVAQRFRVEFAVLRVRGQLSYRDIERALPQCCGQHVARVDQHEYLEAGASLPNGLEGRRDEAWNCSGHGADAQLALGAVAAMLTASTSAGGSGPRPARAQSALASAARPRRRGGRALSASTACIKAIRTG